jgi:hypothetical protein
MIEKNYCIKLLGVKNGDYEIKYKQYTALIPKSCLKDNGLAVKDNKIHISKELYDNWFGKAIEAEAEDNRKRKELFDSFYPYIPLFWANRKMILNEPRYYSIVAPNHFYGAMYICPNNPIVTLGELLRIWENEKLFSIECEECGGKAVVYRFSGSPLSGSIFERKNICTKCAKMGEGVNTISFRDLWRTRAKYRPTVPKAETPAALEELIAICKGETYIADSKISNNTDVVEDTNDFVQIGKRRLTTKQFTNLLFQKNNEETE